MKSSDYWTRSWNRRIGRRRLIGAAAAGATGLAAASVLGCGGDSAGPPSGQGPGAGSDDGLLAALTSEEPHDARRGFDPAPESSRGGTLTYIGFDAVVLDRYDPHQTQFGPMYSNLSAVFSKLYRYASHEEPTWENILPDLAESAPEMIGDPPLTYVVKLRRGVKFHNTEAIRKNFPGLAGRELTADDVIFSYERQTNTASPQKAYYYRRGQYQTIEKMERIDDYTIRFTTKEPTAPFYHFMADTNAMIIPKEIVDMEPARAGDQPWDSVDAFGNREPRPGERMIGTGPWMWGDLSFGIEFSAVRNPEWFGWGDPDLGRPYLDGYKATGQGLNDVTVESLFRRKEIDIAAFIDNPQWLLDAKDEYPELIYQKAQISGSIGTRFKAYCKPFDDWRVRRALHLATDRQEAVDVIGSGVYKMVGPVNGAIKYWALPQEELEALPGYRRGAGREEDIKEARQLYEAAGRPAIPQIWFADIPAYIPRFVETYLATIRQNLGIDQEISHQEVSYQRIAEGYLKECDQAAMTWGFSGGVVDLDDWVYPFYHTDGTRNSFRISDPVLDPMLEAQRREFDTERRRELGLDIQRYLLGVTNPEAPAANVRIDYVSPYVAFVRWPYFKNAVTFPWFGSQYWLAEAWLDRDDPSYAGRAT